MTIEIIHQEKNWICVNKPSGLSVHNQEDETNLKEVLQDQLQVDWLQPVHRLDKETTGLIIFSLNKDTVSKWNNVFTSDKTIKKYLGVTRGLVTPESGTWDLPLTDKGEGRNTPQGIKKAQKPCTTHYKTLQKNKYFALIEFQIETGRQHQIRKHCALAKHCLLGDNRYGDKKYNKRIANMYKVDGMALHSHYLKFEFDGKEIELNAKAPKSWQEKYFSDGN